LPVQQPGSGVPWDELDSNTTPRELMAAIEKLFNTKSPSHPVREPDRSYS